MVGDAWKPAYYELAEKFFSLYFGCPPRLSAVFPSVRSGYPWSGHRPKTGDSRVHAKNNDEYHGLERHAWQYHASAMYEEAYHHFLMAAAHRREDGEVMGSADSGHIEAVRFCVRHALFNKALAEAQRGRRLWPRPETFGIDPAKHDRRVEQAESELDSSFRKK
ncbi:hypothetical protein GCM10010466_62580 [Planomonospora alba]|uniref:Uncharacterized protein n=2 Tax=Planomonospora alba TaxID=161354 RepID=A0ABP6P177_9ACTN